MARSAKDQNKHAHELIDRMAPEQVSAVVTLIEVMLDPLSRSLAHAPDDDEPLTEQEAREAAEAKASLSRGEGIAHEEVLAEFGLSPKEFARMGRAPLKAGRSGR
jgi:ethanolamine utilization microcompartment shell protein EutL